MSRFFDKPVFVDAGMNQLLGKGLVIRLSIPISFAILILSNNTETSHVRSIQIP